MILSEGFIPGDWLQYADLRTLPFWWGDSRFEDPPPGLPKSYNVLKRLYSVNNEALRICTGAFRTSPISSLYAESHEMPPQLRHLQLGLQYAIKLKSNRQNPAYNDIFHGDDAMVDYISDDELSEEE